MVSSKGFRCTGDRRGMRLRWEDNLVALFWFSLEQLHRSESGLWLEQHDTDKSGSTSLSCSLFAHYIHVCPASVQNTCMHHSLISSVGTYRFLHTHMKLHTGGPLGAWQVLALTKSFHLSAPATLCYAMPLQGLHIASPAQGPEGQTAHPWSTLYFQAIIFHTDWSPAGPGGGASSPKGDSHGYGKGIRHEAGINDKHLQILLFGFISEHHLNAHYTPE